MINGLNAYLERNTKCLVFLTSDMLSDSSCPASVVVLSPTLRGLFRTRPQFDKKLPYCNLNALNYSNPLRESLDGPD